MKAAVCEDLNKMVVKDVPTPKCGPEDILVKVRACAICGSDVRIYHYGNPRVKLPQIMGHEISGDVVEVGKKVKRDLKAGDRIAIGADVPCGECYWCQNGMGTNCEINYAIGYQFAGGFAEYILLNETIVKYGPITKIPDDMDYDTAAVAEPLACAINGLTLANVKPGNSVVIIGTGPIGCMMIPLARHFGATTVIAAQRSKNRLEMARKWGADHYICTLEQDIVEEVMKLTNNHGADRIITTCGSVDSHRQAIEMIAHRGVVNLFGGLKNQPKLEIDSNLIHYKECFVMGSHGSLPPDHELAVKMIDKGYVPAGNVITHRMPLDKIVEAIEIHESRSALKVIVNP